MRARQPTTCKAVAALVATAAIAVLAAPAASADVTTVGLGGWQVQSSAQATQSAAAISTPGFAHRVVAARAARRRGRARHRGRRARPDRPLPERVLLDEHEALLRLHDTVGPETIPQFAVPWWFRTDFPRTRPRAHNTDLIVNGVVGEADVWVNGHEVATRDTVQGAYTRYTFDVSGLLHHGANALALEVLPERPEHDVHARQRRLDADPARQQHRHPVPDPAAHRRARSRWQRARRPGQRAGSVDRGADSEGGRHQPRAPTRQTGTVAAAVLARRGAPIRVTQTVTVAAGATQTVSFAPSDDPTLRIDHPSVWWPYRDGRPASVPPAHRAVAARQRTRLDSRRRSASARSPRA